MEKMVDKKGLLSPKKSSLTKAEKEILYLLTDEFLTIKQITLQRKCSRQAVYKIIKRLKEKGAFNLSLQKVYKVQSTRQPKRIRLHNQEFNIKILWQDNKYQSLLEKSNILFIDGNTIRLYRNSIETYSGQNFYGEDEVITTSKSLEYWKRFFTRLEHELKVILVKPRSRNINLVNQHYAHKDSEICESSLERGERIRVYAKEDGKLAFITDDSFGFKEDETVHPKTAKPDRKAIDKQVNDWRLNNPPTNSELAVLQAETSQSLNKTVNTLGILTNTINDYGGHLKSHTGAIIKLNKGINRLFTFLEEKKNIKQSSDSQSTLDNFK